MPSPAVSSGVPIDMAMARGAIPIIVVLATAFDEMIAYGNAGLSKPRALMALAGDMTSTKFSPGIFALLKAPAIFPESPINAVKPPPLVAVSAGMLAMLASNPAGRDDDAAVLSSNAVSSAIVAAADKLCSRMFVLASME